MSAKTALLQSTGEYFHIYNRGVNRERIFFRDTDYRLFLRQVPHCLERVGLSILSYCLMPNHYHFEVRQEQAYAMARFVGRLCDRYVKTINFLNGRVGHLFQGAYTPKWVKSPDGLLYLSRYIHLNPVEAGLVRDPNDWEFSSCLEYFGLAESTFVEKSTILSRFDGINGYRSFLMGDAREEDDALNGLTFDD